MTSWVTLALDTTPPVFTLGGSPDAGQPSKVTLDIDANADAFEMRIWGAIDDTNPANADYGVTENDAVWIPYDGSPIVWAHPAGGDLHVRLRDEVWNETAVKSITTTGGEVIPPTPTTPTRTPGWPGAKPPRHRRAEPTILTSRSRLRVSSHSGVRIIAPSRSRVRTRSAPPLGVRRTHNRSRVILRTRGGIRTSSMVHGSRITIRSGESVDVTAMGPEMARRLIELDIL